MLDPVGRFVEGNLERAHECGQRGGIAGLRRRKLELLADAMLSPDTVHRRLADKPWRPEM
jgi:hypothetical protein